MSLTDLVPAPLERLARFVADELRAYPGRTNVMLRCVLTSAIVIVLSMSLQVPFLALSLIVVFYVVQSNVVVTRMIGVLFIVGSTVAIGCSILVIKFTYDYPLLRILLSFSLFFASVYLMRVVKVGVVFYIIAIVVVYAHTFVDVTDQGEAVMRAELWVWVAVNYAIAVTLLVNALLLPAEPVAQLQRAMRAQLQTVDACLAALGRGETPAAAPGARAVQAAMPTLQKLLRYATMRDPDYRRHQAFHLARIATVSRLVAAAGHLPEPAAGVPAGAVRALRDALGRLDRSIVTGERFVSPDALAEMAMGSLPGALAEMRDALHAFSERSAAPESVESPKERARPAVSDAWTNPVYAQFTAKTSLAAFISYLFYVACDWHGIHTIMLTCLIVAQPSLGATAQRVVLRLAGAAVGSAIAVAMAVWVVPRLDDVVGLLGMTLPVIALGSWIAAGSERISYAGVQLMFTFALALLERFGPTTDLTEIRDRMIGIVLGVVISALVHASFWPEAEGEALRQRVAALLRRLAAHLRRPDGDEATPPVLWVELGDCEVMAARVALEPGWQMGEGQPERFTVHAQTILAQTREILLATDAFDAERRAQPAPKSVGPVAMAWRDSIGAALDGYADDLREHPDAVRAPTPASPDAIVAGLAPVMPTFPTDAARSAYERLHTRARQLTYRVSTLPEWHGESADTSLVPRATQA
ncbi:multidrug resistance protein MdtO [Burkholderia multivorans]